MKDEGCGPHHNNVVLPRPLRTQLRDGLPAGSGHGHGGPAQHGQRHGARGARGRRDAPAGRARARRRGGRAPGGLAIEGRLPARTTEPRLRRPRLPDEEQARGARGVRRVRREARPPRQRRLPLLGGHARRQAVVVPPGADGGHRQGRGPPAVRRARPEPLLRARPRRLGRRRGRRALRDAVEQGFVEGQHQLAALRQGCGQPRAPRGLRAERRAPGPLRRLLPPRQRLRAAGPGPMRRRRRASRRQDVRRRRLPAFCNDGGDAARVPGARKNGAGLRRASQIRVLEVSLASAGRVHGQLQPQSEWIVAARGRRAALGGGVRRILLSRFRGGPHAPRRRRVLRAVGN